MVQVVKSSRTQTVIAERRRTVTVEVNTPDVMTAADRGLVEVVKRKQSVTTVGTVGVQGPPGQDGAISGTTDLLAEGTTNLYFTDERAQDAVGHAVIPGDGADLIYDDASGAFSAANTDKGTVALALHNSLVDPHPQYLDANENIDGGNF